MCSFPEHCLKNSSSKYVSLVTSDVTELDYFTNLKIITAFGVRSLREKLTTAFKSRIKKIQFFD